MRRPPKKLRKALRNLPDTKNKRDHRRNIGKAAARYDKRDFHPLRFPWSYRC